MTTVKSHIVDSQQGSEEWHQHRARSFNASELAAAMGISPYLSRSELIAQKATCMVPDVDQFKQRIFDNGHRYEAIARPWAEDIIGEELFPVVLSAEVDGMRLSASFDGLTIDNNIAWEHKTAGVDLLENLESGVIPEQYHPQMEQGMMLSNATRCLFMASNGNRDTMRFVWYESRPELRAKIIQTWKQIQADVATYKPSTTAVTPIANAVASLPVVFDMRVEGRLVACNLEQYKPAALAYIEEINVELDSDQSFADAEADAKFCRESADKLNLAIEQAMGQIGDVNAAINTVRDIASAFNAKGLKLEKLVKARKESIRDEIQAQAVQTLAAQVAEENKAIDPRHAVAVPHEARARIATAMKGKKTVASLRNAADTCRAQIAVELVAKITARKAALSALVEAKAAAPELAGQCHDERDLVDMQPDHLRLLLDNRLAKLRAAEYARQEAERERIRAEERAKAEREAREQVEAERRAEAARQHSEAERQKAENERKRIEFDRVWNGQHANLAEAESEAAARQLVDQAFETPVAVAQAATQPALEAANTSAATAPATGPMLKLGEINARLAPISISADGLDQLGFTPAATDRASRLYRAADLPLILDAMVQHIKGVGLALYLAA